MGTRTKLLSAATLNPSLITILVLISINLWIPQAHAQVRKVKHKSGNEDVLRHRFNYNPTYCVTEKFAWNDMVSETQTHPRSTTCSLNMFATLHDAATKQGKPNPCMPPPRCRNTHASSTPKLQTPAYLVPLLCSSFLGFLVFLVLFDHSPQGLLGRRRGQRRRQRSIISAQERRQVCKLSKHTQGKYLEELLGKYIVEVDIDDCEEYEHGRCVVCLEDLVVTHHETKHARLISCQHAFHADCILDWLKHENSSCPVCRRTVFL